MRLQLNILWTFVYPLYFASEFVFVKNSFAKFKQSGEIRTGHYTILDEGIILLLEAEDEDVEIVAFHKQADGRLLVIQEHNDAPTTKLYLKKQL